MRTPLVSLTAVALAASVAAAAAAQSAPPAQRQRVNVRGTIVAADASAVTVATNGTQQKIALTAATRLQYVVPLDFAKIEPGSFVGSAAVPQPDGTLRAVEVHVIPGGRGRVAEGQTPHDVGAQTIMNNATVGAVDAPVAGVDSRTLTLAFKDGDKKLVVPEGTPITTYTPADLKALVPGAHVFVIALRDADGSLSAVAVSVGKDGLVPPM